MDTFAEIADERRGLADLMSGLTSEQQATQSLCSEWSVREVLAHLVVPLEVGIPKFALAVLACRGSFDGANVRLAREQARRPFEEMIEVLRRKAEVRFTPPGSGPEAPLTDLLIHGLDIRWPLGLARIIPEERLTKSLTFLTATPARWIRPQRHGGWAAIRGDGYRLGPGKWSYCERGRRRAAAGDHRPRSRTGSTQWRRGSGPARPSGVTRRRRLLPSGEQLGQAMAVAAAREQLLAA